jgi:hypothetical protein
MCQTADGTCAIVNRSNGIFCNDGNPCTYNEQCSSGNCAGSGRLNVQSATPCNDRNDCTTGETCNGSGACTGGTNVAAGTACDDYNDCTSSTTCNGSGLCTNGTPAATGTQCVMRNPGDSLPGNTCLSGGTCQPWGFSVTCQGGTPKNEGATCTNGDPCNAGFCSAGSCIRRDPTRIPINGVPQVVEDYNSCTDPSSTTCTQTGLVQGASCIASGTCVACSLACGTDPNVKIAGEPIPCSCTYTQ